MSTIGLVLGKPAGRSPVIGEVADRLRAQGHLVMTHVPGRDAGLPSWLDHADLVALRGLDPRTLQALAEHDPSDVRFLDTPGALLAAQDRPWTANRLRDVGLATPPWWPAPTWREATELITRHAGRFVVKHTDGSIGRSARVWMGDAGTLPAQPPFAGPFHVERDVGSGRTEVKLYRVGQHTAAFERRATRFAAIPVDARLHEVTVRAAGALGLSLAGFDLLVDTSEVAVIDVNAFPSCRRLPDAAQRIADHLVARARAPALAVTPVRDDVGSVP